MIICFKCSQRTKTLLDRIVESEQYLDYGDAISSAVENLVAIQEELLTSKTLVIQHDGHTALTDELREQTNQLFPSPADDRRGQSIEFDQHAKRAVDASERSIRVPDLFTLNVQAASSIPVTVQPTDTWGKGQNVPLERWMFGQYNKLLPAKASCRALANLTARSGKGVALLEAAELISREATVLGRTLAHYDKRNRASRGNALATAFPTSVKDDAEKSRLRYAHQFVATVNKQGQVSGLLIDLKLVNSGSGKLNRLSLTEAGKQFALLENPAIDALEPQGGLRLSSEEVSFLLDHIASRVPVEDFAYRCILAAVSDGANTPSKIDQALRRHISAGKEGSLSESFLASQRSGAISRMEDLRLIVRERVGVRVSYALTEAGQRYMAGKVAQGTQEA